MSEYLSEYQRLSGKKIVFQFKNERQYDAALFIYNIKEMRECSPDEAAQLIDDMIDDIGDALKNKAYTVEDYPKLKEFQDRLISMKEDAIERDAITERLSDHYKKLHEDFCKLAEINPNDEKVIQEIKEEDEC